MRLRSDTVLINAEKRIQIMSKWIKRKEFESLFASVNAEGKNIWVIHSVKELPSEVIFRDQFFHKR